MRGLLLVISFLWLGKVPAAAQHAVLEITNGMSINALQELTGPYFKTLPYNKSFSSFLKQILADPDLQDKVVERRTDSTYFFASGTYQRYNPFLYRPSKVKLVVTESDFTDSDSSLHRDTVLYCQLLVVADSTAGAGKFVKREYQRLMRKAARRFSYNTYALGTADRAAEGEMGVCFIPPFAVSPLTIAWSRNEASRNYTFTISLRMKIKENRAAMVTLPQESLNSSQ